MEMLLRVIASRPAGVHEEAMLAVGALTNALGAPFLKYMEPFYPVLERGLQNHQARCVWSWCWHWSVGWGWGGFHGEPWKRSLIHAHPPHSV